jgi:hypothetical protein
MQQIGLIVLAAILVLFFSHAPASDNDEHKTKPAPKPPVVVQQAPDTDRHTSNFLGAAAVSMIATDVLKEQQYGAVKAFAATVFSAALIEASQSGGYNGSNVWYAVGGAAVGTVGACAIYLKKNFIGCGMPF